MRRERHDANQTWPASSELAFVEAQIRLRVAKIEMRAEVTSANHALRIFEAILGPDFWPVMENR